jgi:hypothetical protein
MNDDVCAHAQTRTGRNSGVILISDQFFFDHNEAKKQLAEFLIKKFATDIKYVVATRNDMDKYEKGAGYYINNTLFLSESEYELGIDRKVLMQDIYEVRILTLKPSPKDGNLD